LLEKVDAKKNFSKPTVKQLRQLLGMINFYRRFIPGAAKDQATLNDMFPKRPENQKQNAHKLDEAAGDSL